MSAPHSQPTQLEVFLLPVKATSRNPKGSALGVPTPAVSPGADLASISCRGPMASLPPHSQFQLHPEARRCFPSCSLPVSSPAEALPRHPLVIATLPTGTGKAQGPACVPLSSRVLPLLPPSSSVLPH
uniref:Uncharacterized protein n=1 Tax=Piliocolobus tephrosceles TaxID=591936 RepID=A0A8C9HQ10_9PRIM